MKIFSLIALVGVMAISANTYAGGPGQEIQTKTLEDRIASGRPGGISPQYLRVRYFPTPVRGADPDETENSQPDDNYVHLNTRGTSFYDWSTSTRK